MTELRFSLEYLINHITQVVPLPIFLLPLVRIVIILAVVILLDLLLRLIFLRTLPKLMRRVPMLSDIGEAHRTIISKVIRVVAVSIFKQLLPLANNVNDGGSVFVKVLGALASIYIAVLIIQLFGRVFDAARNFMISRESQRSHPLINVFQILKVVVLFLGVIYIFSVLFSVPVKTIFTSMAAASAVLMLVFKDTIMGFVAGIQLTSGNLLRIGDWITVPKYNVDGDVIDITLHSVTIRNFDKTISTVPPYALMSDTFINWRGMEESGARRVKRSLFIDMQTIRYVDDEIVCRLTDSPVFLKYIEKEIEEIRQTGEQKAFSAAHSRRGLTNTGLFRRYILELLRDNERIRKDFTLMVRQREPEERGLPIELCFFTDTTVWSEYEDIQNEVFDHLYAVIQYFGLTIFQAQNSTDVNKLTEALRNLGTSYLECTSDTGRGALVQREAPASGVAEEK